MDRLRYDAELQVLSRRLPSNAYRFSGIGTSAPSCLMAVKTNNGKVYTIKIDLSSFPTSVPKVFVTKMLKTKNGDLMSGCSATMHTLQSENGCTRICHYGSTSWNANVSIYKIYVKCCLWLNMYELHLQTGKNMDYYLNHQA